MKTSLFPITLALIGFVHAQNTTNSSQSRTAPSSSSTANTATTPANSHKPAESMAAQRSYEVSDLLDATNEARTAVEAQNQQDALFHVDHALDKAEKTQSLAPNQRVVSLYDELDRYSVLGPIMTQQQEQSTTSPSNTTNTTKEHATKEHTTVREVQGQYTSVGLDIQAAKDHLMAAKQAINQSDWQKADAALAAVQNGMILATVATDMPLVRARENMILARRSAENGHLGETHAALTSASNALKEYERSQGHHAADARTLQAQIDTYNQSIQQDHTNAVSKIDSWWDQMTGWTSAANDHKKG